MSITAARIPAWIPGSLAAVAVISFAAGSSSLASVKHLGHTARWLALFLLCAVALLRAVPRLRRNGLPPGLRAVGWLSASFLALCLLSTAWSPDPRLTFARTASLGILFLAAAAIAVAAATDPAEMRRLLEGLALGAAVVAAIGFVMLALGAREAAQPASPLTPWRFRGFGENPNTVAVLAAVALPIIAWLGLTTQTRRSRALWLASFAALLATTIASGSRGGQLAALCGVEAVVLTTVPRVSRRILVGVAYALVIIAGIGLRQVTQPAAPAFYSAIPKPAPGVQSLPPPPAGGSSSGQTTGNGSSPPKKLVIKIARGAALQPLPDRASEIGHPALSREGTSTVGSGRVAAWIGTLKDNVLQRPLLGYGFGTEERVFVDRWYGFQGGTPENSTIGILLQVGFVGLLLVVALVAVVATGAVRGLRSGKKYESSAGSVGLGVLMAALALTFFQAYVYSVGNVATLTVWVVMFLTAAATVGARVEGRGRA
ncbi:MAG TPA: O-antigen ligase family protein [Microbacteriaceae bacterium]|jgi:O-antigen ligase|nr:O-antigen ligase family protein [Microbacteriaceae bacterium]